MNACPTCNFELWNPVDTGFTLRVSDMGIYDDARFPGRSILRLRDHATDLTAVEPHALMDFMLDIQTASAAIKQASGADRINVAILGNTERHVHAHLIPRIRSREPLPDRSPWDDPRPKESLNSSALAFAVARIGKLIQDANPVTHPETTRIEVIEKSTRAFVGYFDAAGADIQTQDDGRTIKVFAEGALK